MGNLPPGLGSSPLSGALEGFAIRRPPPEDPAFDVTAMIDLVFMMNIYFLFTFIGARASEIDLPTANYAAPLDVEEATTVTILNGTRWETVDLFLGDGKVGAPITSPDEQAAQVRKLVRQGLSEGKSAVLIKAEANVRLRHLRQLGASLAEEPVQLYLGVIEKDTQ